MTIGNKLITGYVIGSLILFVIGGFWISNLYSSKTQDKAALIASTDTVHHYKTSDGKNAAYIQTPVADRSELLALTKRNDTLAYELFQANKKITDFTHIKTATRVDTVTRLDTEYVEVNGAKIKPDSLVIDKSISTKWYNAKVSVRADTLGLHLVSFDEYLVAHQYKSMGLFKPDQLTVNVINENPNSVNVGLSSYQIPPAKQKRAVPFVAGAVVTAIAMFLLHK